MKNKTFMLNLAKITKQALTFCLTYATLSLGYTGIVVYFAGLKSQAVKGNFDQQDKNQNKKQKRQIAKISDLTKNPLVSGLLKSARQSQIKRLDQAEILESGNNALAVTLAGKQSNLIIAFITFCFLSKRFFVKNLQKRFSNQESKLCQPQKINIKNKKEQNNDCWLLSFRRHLARNRSQQNHGDSLGRSGINSQSFARQPRLALLYPISGRRNYRIGSRNRLLSQAGCFGNKLSNRFILCFRRFWLEAIAPSLNFESFIITEKIQYVFIKNSNSFNYSPGYY